jgi:hypothetical protein
VVRRAKVILPLQQVARLPRGEIAEVFTPL